MTTTTESQRTNNQKKTVVRNYHEDGQHRSLVVTLRFDDDCKNGHNTFSATAGEYQIVRGKRRDEPDCCGMMHDAIAKHAPQLAKYLKWHLCSTDGPMHYVANARYWAGFCGFKDGKPNSPPNAAYLRSTIVFGAVPQWDNGRTPESMEDDELVQWLHNRLPDLLDAFRADMEELGFTW